MSDRELRNKAIEQKGKLYVPAKDRIKYFVDTYPGGAINTEIVTDGDTVIVKAEVYRDITDTRPAGTGYAEEKRGTGYVNANFCLENCETSAVGRALGFLDIGVIDSIGSADEVKSLQKDGKQRLEKALLAIESANDFLAFKKLEATINATVPDEYLTAADVEKIKSAYKAKEEKFSK